MSITARDEQLLDYLLRAQAIDRAINQKLSELAYLDEVRKNIEAEIKDLSNQCTHYTIKFKEIVQHDLFTPLSLPLK